MPIPQGGDWWRRYFKEFFILEIELFEQGLQAALPSDKQIEERVYIAEQKACEKWPDPEDFEQVEDEKADRLHGDA